MSEGNKKMREKIKNAVLRSFMNFERVHLYDATVAADIRSKQAKLMVGTFLNDHCLTMAISDKTFLIGHC